MMTTNEIEIINPEKWLQLGLGGAALVILFAFVVLFMFLYVRSNNKNISNLCSKIDKLAGTNTEMAKAMTQVFTKSSADQLTTQNTLNQIHDGVNDLKASVDSLAAKTDALFELKCRPLNHQK